MKKETAIQKAQEFHDEVGEHAYVVDMGGTFEWHSESYFYCGFEGGYIIWGTDDGDKAGIGTD